MLLENVIVFQFTAPHMQQASRKRHVCDSPGDSVPASAVWSAVLKCISLALFALLIDEQLSKSLEFYFQDLMHKLRLTDRSHKQQLSSEKNKQTNLQKKLQTAEKEIEDLKKDLKVNNNFVAFPMRHAPHEENNLLCRKRRRLSTAVTSTRTASAAGPPQRPAAAAACLRPAA
jgi:hypothetical protein